jgi:hypothetical protein
MEPIEETKTTGEAILIGNEFARVRFEKVPGPGGDHLLVSSARTGRSRILSPEAVERVSRLPVGHYLDALLTPFGPEPELAFTTGSPVHEEEEE